MSHVTLGRLGRAVRRLAAVRLHRRAAIAAASIGGLALSLAGIASASAQTSSPVVETHAGAVRGLALPYTNQFLGIPYAKAPVGALRWQPPRPASWPGVRTTTTEPSACPQLPTPDPGLTDGSTNQNCLDLDVITPAKSRHKRPVYVFIHGGGYQVGHLGYENMNQFVQKTGVVAVTIQYRLGALGFIDVPGLTTSDTTGNFGIADQELALKWVHANIGRFGGDPHHVVVGGQSAGGSSVCALLNSPQAKGLFAGAILESPAPCSSDRPKAAVQKQSLAVAKRLGCSDTTTMPACLRAKPTAAILKADGPTLGVWAPETGTPLQPRPVAKSFTSGNFNRMPVLLGTNGKDIPGLPCAVQSLARSLSRWVPTYRYDFDDVDAPPLPGRPASVAGFGPQHSAELAYLYLFDGLPSPLTAVQQNLADTMISYWGNFTDRLNPNGARLPSWTRFAAHGQPVMTFTESGAQVTHNLSKHYGCK